MSKASNCRKINKDNCPLKGNCLIKNAIYKVKVESKDPNKICIRSTAGSFKDRYANHKHTFKNINKKQSTRLSDYVWSFFHRYFKTIIRIPAPSYKYLIIISIYFKLVV